MLTLDYLNPVLTLAAVKTMAPPRQAFNRHRCRRRRRLRIALLDKTGTLTVGSPEVERVVRLDGLAEEELLAWRPPSTSSPPTCSPRPSFMTRTTAASRSTSRARWPSSQARGSRGWSESGA